MIDEWFVGEIGGPGVIDRRAECVFRVRRVMDAEFAEFVSARYAHLCRSAYLLVGDAASAEDLVQEALLRVLAAYRRGRIEELEAYTRAAIVNLSVSGWRRQARGSALLGKWSVGAGPHRADPTIAVDLHEALWGGRSG